MGCRGQGTGWGGGRLFLQVGGRRVCPFHTRRQGGPEFWGWECSASCKGIQKSHCVWYFASQLASDSNIRSNRYFGFYIWKEAFFTNGELKNFSWKHWSLITLHPIVLKIESFPIPWHNPLKCGGCLNRYHYLVYHYLVLTWIKLMFKINILDGFFSFPSHSII